MKRVKAESSDSCLSSDEIEIPEGWQNLCLSDVADLISGAGFPEILQGQQNLQYPFFKVGNLGEVESGHLLFTSKHTVDERIVKELHAKIIPPDSIVFAKIGMAIALNRRRMIGVASCIDNNMMAAVPNEKILPRYLLRFLETVEFMPFTQATTVPSLRKSDLAQIQIPLPPLSEQEHIVARVEALLTNVNAARDKLSRVPLIMKKFRQAVLAAACSGRLTEGWRDGNLSSETSDQLIERVTQELQNNSVKNKKNSVVQLTQWNAPEPLELLEIPEHWTWIAVKDVTSLLQYGISVKSDSEEKNGIPILRMGNIQDGSIDLTDLKYIPANTDSISNFIVDPGDILFNRTNSPELVGKSAVYNEKLQTVFASYLVRVRPNNNLILSDYLCWWINSMWGREWARNVRTDGVSQSNINAQKLSMMPVPLPPLAEQHEIVPRVGLLFERADAFDQEVTAAGRRCERLTQAVLAKAFRGELVR